MRIGCLRHVYTLAPVFHVQQSILSEKSELHQRSIHKNVHDSKFVTVKNWEEPQIMKKAQKTNRTHIMEKHASIKIDVYK